MIIHRNRKELLRPVLTDHVLVEEGMDLHRLMKGLYLIQLAGRLRGFVEILDIVTCKLDTVSTYARIKSLEKKRHFIFAPSAEHTVPA